RPRNGRSRLQQRPLGSGKNNSAAVTALWKVSSDVVDALRVLVSKCLNLVVRLFQRFFLPDQQFPDKGGQGFMLQCLTISPLRGIFSRLAIGQDGMTVVPGKNGFHVHPCPVYLTTGRRPLFGFP